MLMIRDFRYPQAQDFSMLFVVEVFRVICFYLGCKVLKMQDAIVGLVKVECPLRYPGLKNVSCLFVNDPLKMGGYKPQNKETLPTSLSAKKPTKPKQLNDAEGLRCLAASNKPGGSGGMDVWTHVRLTSCWTHQFLLVFPG